jgi:hypothetical protein
MSRTLGALILGAIVCSATILSAADDQKTEIKGGIEGKVKAVDVEGKKLTIATAQGRERTFTITDETVMVGPRGGKVRHHLRDPRFHEGFPVTIVAEGNTAEEVHLGFAKDAAGAEHVRAAKQGTRAGGPSETGDRTKLSKNASTPETDAATIAKHIARHKEATKLEEEDDEEEIPGHIKSFDVRRRMLVVTLFNGNSRSFIVAQDVPVHIKGAAAASRQGLKDPQLKAGAFVTVVTDEGGRKVKELKITPASADRRKKAG